MSEVVSWVGSICSIVGALCAVKQASIAKGAAKLSESIKKQLISHRKTSELAELQALLNTARKAFAKYGASNPSALKGIDHNADAVVALDFIHKLKSFRDYFDDHFNNYADDTYNEISDELVEFKKTKSGSKISVRGAKILSSIVSFSPNLKRELTTQRESTVE